MTGQYLNGFQKIISQGKVKLFGDLVVVEPLPSQESREIGGLVVKNSSHARAMFSAENDALFVLVVAVSEEYADIVKPGNVIMIPPAAIRKYAAFGALEDYEPDTLGITTVSSIQMQYNSLSEYYEAFGILSNEIKTTL